MGLLCSWFGHNFGWYQQCKRCGLCEICENPNCEEYHLKCDECNIRIIEKIHGRSHWIGNDRVGGIAWLCNKCYSTPQIKEKWFGKLNGLTGQTLIQNRKRSKNPVVTVECQRYEEGPYSIV